jgi:hypothetical protein
MFEESECLLQGFKKTYGTYMIVFDLKKMSNYNLAWKFCHIKSWPGFGSGFNKLPGSGSGFIKKHGYGSGFSEYGSETLLSTALKFLTFPCLVIIF